MTIEDLAEVIRAMDARIQRRIEELRAPQVLQPQLGAKSATENRGLTNVEQELDRLNKMVFTPVEDDASEQLNGVGNRTERIANLEQDRPPSSPDPVARCTHGVGKVAPANISAKQISGSKKLDRGSQHHRESDLCSPHSSHATGVKTSRAPRIDSSDFNTRWAPLSIGSNRNSHRVGTNASKKSSTRREAASRPGGDVQRRVGVAWSGHVFQNMIECDIFFNGVRSVKIN